MSRFRGSARVGLISTEEVRRRALLLSVGALLLLSFGPIFGHHFASGLEHGLRGRDHLGPLCLISLHEILAPVHYVFHALIVSGLLYAAYDRIRSAYLVRRVLAPLHIETAVEGDAFWSAARAANVDPLRVQVVDGLPNPAFTVGWLRPRIFVARALQDTLSPQELEAVIAHEGAHVSRRDPLRLSVLRFLALTLFWIPALRRFAADVADEVEIQADDVARRERPLALALAILRLARWRQPYPVITDIVGFGERATLLDRRIRRLAGEQPSPESHVTRRSVLGAVVALALVWTSGAVMAHPLPEEHAERHLLHCEHPGEPAVSHLVCFPEAFRAESDHCPHLSVGLADPRR